MHWSFRKEIRYGKIKYPLKDIKDLLFFELNNEVSDDIRYPSRKMISIGFGVWWVGFMWKTALKKDTTRWYRKLRWPISISVPIYRRTIFFFDGKWQESLKLGWIVNETIGIAIANSTTVSRFTIS